MKPRTRSLLLLLLTVLGMALTARLGFWQLDRAAQKQALQAAIERRAELPALTGLELLPEPAAAQAQVHRKVRLRGHWLDDKTVFLDNRPMQGRVGFFVLTPLHIEGRREALLVQRGWVPRDGLDRSRLPELPRSSGVVEVEGRLAVSASRLYEFSSVVSGRIRQNVEVTEYSTEIKQALLPLTLVQSRPDNAAGADGLLRDWVAPAAGLHKNYGYAFQWFALCALILGLYVWFQTIRPRRHARPQ